MLIIKINTLQWITKTLKFQKSQTESDPLVALGNLIILFLKIQIGKLLSNHSRTPRFAP